MLEITNLRRVKRSDESGERDAVVGDFCIDGAELAIVGSADLMLASRPAADDARLVARPFAEAVQALPSE